METHRTAQLDHSAEQLAAEQRAKAVEEEAGALQAHEEAASQATRAPAAKPTQSGAAVDRASLESRYLATRLAMPPRYLATRLAMPRQAVGDGAIALRKTGTRDNPR